MFRFALLKHLRQTPRKVEHLLVADLGRQIPVPAFQ